ncbi:nucleotidyltransferase family protein [Polluticoccus soli]|uniref:nucleotidyltransferase family protein n=1 Tax=Polluticoccus soli TaxID=3034150 RepID=UPI0023E0D9FB|nr:nucleotidyltransferase family protein [Flavipsychrobacter sp. JY13-12]
MIPISEIAKRYNAEMALLVLIGRAGFKKSALDEVVTHISQSSIDWHLFEKIVVAHKLRPLVYRILLRISDHVAPDYIERLRSDVLKIAAGNLMKLDELMKLHAVLNDSRVVNIPYKGLLLSRLLYDDFVTRETGDIDFLINARDFRTAKEVLLASGYIPASFFDAQFEDRFVKTESELLLTRQTPLGIMKVELHWEVTHRMLDAPIDVMRLFDRSKRHSISSKEVCELNVEDHLMIVLVHHGVNDVWRVLRHVTDLAAFAEADGQLIASPEIKKLLKQAGIRRTSAIGLQLCHSLFGVGSETSERETPEYNAVLSRLLTFPVLKKRKLSAENVRQQFLLRDSLRARLRLGWCYLREGFTPNMRDVATLRLPDHLHFLYYLLKPFLFLVRKK